MPPENTAPATARTSAGSGDIVHRQAGIAPGSYDKESRTVEAVFSKGSAVRRWGYVEVLEISEKAIDLSRVEKGLVNLLDTHNRWQLDSVLGTISDVRVESGALVGKISFADTEEGRKIEGMVARGEVKGISIGYAIRTFETTKAEGEKPEVRKATQWELMEVSLVPVPADPEAGIRSEQAIETRTEGQEDAGNGSEATPQKRNDTMPKQKQGGGGTPAPETREQPANTPAPSQPGSQVEQRTYDAFRSSDAIAFVDMARGWGDEMATRATELVKKVDQDEMGPDQARSALLADIAKQQRGETETDGIRSTVSATVTSDEMGKFMRGAANAVMQRAGITHLVREAAQAKGDELDLDPGEFRGMRLVDIAAMCNERNGVTPASRSPEDIVRAALGGFATRDVNPQGLQGTADFAVLLGNVVRQTIQAAYATVPDTWRKFCAVGSVTDFRPHYRVRLSTFGSLKVVNENGEFENQSIPDGSRESISAQTKGMIVALTRQAIINDDLSAFSTLAVQLGRIAARTIEEDVYATLALNSGLGPVMADGKTLFHADHGNIGAGAALSVDALDADDAKMAAQKDRGGKEYLDLSPSVLLVPRGLKGDAIVINGAEYDPNKAGKDMVPNKVRGLFDDIVASPRLSGTRRYIFADPNIAPALEVAFLNGEQQPFIDQQDGFRVDGVEWKVRHDYGVGAVDYPGALTDAGA